MSCALLLHLVLLLRRSVPEVTVMAGAGTLVMTSTRLRYDPQLVSSDYAGSDMSELSCRVLYLRSKRWCCRGIVPTVVAQLWQRASNIDTGHVLEPQLPMVSDIFARWSVVHGILKEV